MTAPAVRTLQEMDALRATLDTTGGYRDYLTGYMTSRLDLTDKAHARRQADDFVRRTNLILTGAGEAFHVQPEMMPLVTWAADTLPDDTPFEQHTLPAPAGFMWLGEPVICRSIRRDSIVLRAITWGPGFAGEDGKPGVTVTWWSDPTDPRDDESSRDAFHRWVALVRPASRLIPAHVTTMPFGEAVGAADHLGAMRAMVHDAERVAAELVETRAEAHERYAALRARSGADHVEEAAAIDEKLAQVDEMVARNAVEVANARETYLEMFGEHGSDRERALADLDDPEAALTVTNLDRWAVALWTLMGQTVTTTQPVTLGGGAGRAWIRKRLRPQVTVIHLRAAARGPREPGESDRKYAVRWVRRGHWRNQRHGPGRQETRLIWISPTVCGPEGAPLVVTKHVYDLAR